MKRIIFASLLLLLLSLPSHAEWYSDSQEKMGTRIDVRLWHDDEVTAQRLIARAMAEFDRIEAGMSTYRSDSEISRLNARAPHEAVPVSAELFGLIERALQLADDTGGAFDITYDSVGHFYDYRAKVRPSDEQIDNSLAAIDYRYLQLDREHSTIRYDRPGVIINLGGIAKGYAVESVINLLRDAGIRHAMATAGGDTRLLGDRRGRPWMVGIRDPDSQEDVVTRLALIDEAISTSGDYERFFIEDDVRYHHILNPDTGRSAGVLRSASVIGPDATVTDGLSTSVFVLGPEKGLELIESCEGYEAVLIDPDHSVHFSSGLDPR
jgi:thiamine biosynthesis lipoprotein